MKSLKNKLFINSIAMVLFLVLVGCSSAQTPEQKKIIDDAEKAKAEFIRVNPNMANMFENAAGYVIFPNVGEGAYIVGAAAGQGAVYDSGTVVGTSQMTELDIGLQIGGQAYMEAILFQTEKELEHFKSENFEFTSTVSAVILEEGVSKSVSFRDGVAVVMITKGGAMAELSVGGQRFEYYPL